MPSLNDVVVVIVVNAISIGKKQTNYFDTSVNTITSASNSIQDSMGNQHARTNIQKQAYSSTVVKTIKGAYGITGTDFTTHSAYVNGKLMNVSSSLTNGSEVVLIKNDLNPREALLSASRHQLLPMKTNPVIPNRLGEILPPLVRPVDITFESTTIDPGEAGKFGPGGAGNPGGYKDFGGETP